MMTKQEFNDRFALNLEKKRCQLGMSQCQMAKALDVSLSVYKRIVNGETQKVDIYTCYLGYMLGGLFLYQMVDYEDKYTKVFNKVQKLDDKKLKIVGEILDCLSKE